MSYRRVALGYGIRLAFVGVVTWLGARVLAQAGFLTTDTAAVMAVVGYALWESVELILRYIHMGGLE